MWRETAGEVFPTDLRKQRDELCQVEPLKNLASVVAPEQFGYGIDKYVPSIIGITGMALLMFLDANCNILHASRKAGTYVAAGLKLPCKGDALFSLSRNEQTISSSGGGT